MVELICRIIFFKFSFSKEENFFSVLNKRIIFFLRNMFCITRLLCNFLLCKLKGLFKFLILLFFKKKKASGVRAIIIELFNSMFK